MISKIPLLFLRQINNHDFDFDFYVAFTDAQILARVKVVLVNYGMPVQTLGSQTQVDGLNYRGFTTIVIASKDDVFWEQQFALFDATKIFNTNPCNPHMGFP